MTAASARSRVCALRVDLATWRRISAFAAGHAVPPSQALRRLVLLALDESEGLRPGDTAPLEEGIERLQRLLQRVGPVVVALPHLLAYWATRDMDDETSPDELAAEFHANAAQLWLEALEDRGALDTEEPSTATAPTAGACCPHALDAARRATVHTTQPRPAMKSGRPSRIDLYPGREMLADLRSYATGHGVSVSAAACSAIEVGLASLQQSDEPRRTRLDTLEARIERAETMLHLIGPPALGLPSLIAYWAVRSGALYVNEEELLDEFLHQAQSLWQSEVEGIDQPAGPATKGE